MQVAQVGAGQGVLLRLQLLLVRPGYQFLEFAREFLLAQPLAVSLQLAGGVEEVLAFPV